MSRDQDRGEPSLPLPLVDRVDRLCDHFEAEWLQGRRPRIEDYLAREHSGEQGPDPTAPPAAGGAL